MGLFDGLFNVSAMVSKYISKIGKSLAKKHNVSPASVKVTIMYNEKGEPAIAFYISNGYACPKDSDFKGWLSSQEIEELCAD